MNGARRAFAGAALAITLTATGGVAASAHGGSHHQAPATKVFTLAPDPAANPEGIAADSHGRFYVSITGDGAIYSGKLGNPTVSPFIAGATGGSAVGLEIRKGKLYVAGGATGLIKVYDLKTKALLGTFDTGAGGFLNDLVVTSKGDVFVTDSFRPMLWHVTAAQVAAGTGTPQGLDVSASIAFTPGAFNLNGIVAKDRHTLVVIQSNTGQLWRVKLSKTNDAISKISEVTGVSLPGGDGMILDRGQLVVVQGDPAQLHFVKLRHGARKARDLGTQTSDTLHGPSTVARVGKFYLVVNADFANAASPPFTVSALARGNGHHGHGH